MAERDPMPDREEVPGVRTSGGQRLPTSAGGTSGIDPERPGQSLGQVPDRDDDDRDEAGDPDAAGPGTHDGHRD